MSGRFAVYAETKLPIGANDSIAEVKEALAKFYPEVRNFQGYIDEENNIRFKSQGGSKGAGRFAIYAETKLPVGDNDSIQEVKEALAKFYPEVRNFAGYIDEENNIRFKSQGGSKG